MLGDTNLCKYNEVEKRNTDNKTLLVQPNHLKPYRIEVVNCYLCAIPTMMSFFKCITLYVIPTLRVFYVLSS